MFRRNRHNQGTNNSVVKTYRVETCRSKLIVKIVKYVICIYNYAFVGTD